MIVGITGHRPNKLGNEYAHTGKYSSAVRAELTETFKGLGITRLITGMALGVDTIAAHVALDMGVPITAAVPFKGQCNKWSMEAQVGYWYILQHPNTTVVYCSEGGYTPQAMQVRNEWIVNNCELLVAVWDGSEGGTCNCLNYADHVGRNQMVLPIPEIMDEWE